MTFKPVTHYCVAVWSNNDWSYTQLKPTLREARKALKHHPTGILVKVVRSKAKGESKP